METTFTIQSETGGFVLFDPNLSAVVDDLAVMSLNVVFDPKGQTCAVDDFPGREWREVWQEGVVNIHEGPLREGLCVVLVDEGAFAVRVQDTPLGDDIHSSAVAIYRTQLRLTEGVMAVIDGMQFFDDSGIIESDVVRLPAGVYDVELAQMPNLGSSVIIGGPASETSPIAIVSLQLTAESPVDFTNVILLENVDLNKTHKSGCLSYARITRVEDGTAHYQLYVTASTMSGRGRFPVPEGMEFGRDDEVVVRLADYTGNYWQSDFIERR